MSQQPESARAVRTGWRSRLSLLGMAALLFLSVSGLIVTFGPFHAVVQWSVLLHTAVGAALLVPLVWYGWRHWQDYRGYTLSHIAVLGYVAVAALAVCLVSGVVVTWQGLLAVRMAPFWRYTHLVSTFVVLATTVPHVVVVIVHMRRKNESRPVAPFLVRTAGFAVVLTALVVPLSALYSGTHYVNEFPEDYNFVYGEDRPFAPSLARTDTGGAFDPRSLANSESCGTVGCHEQIVAEWKPSAHRYSAMDVLFQKIQAVMAEQNGAESTRYCGGCHDPISLFSGNKNLFADELTDARGYHEGVSCLVCHSVRETDLQGNANYVMVQPREYLWQWKDEGPARLARDFLIRTYPDEHNRLSKRMFKTPEYCAACHKQFIDQEINRVGWVQLQNQYDNWAASHWFVKGDPSRTIECRECHMPLVESEDPAAGDPNDYNRSPGDRKHRSHRFIASNQLMPKMLELEGWERQLELTEAWLKGEFEIPEIRDKWAEGPIVQVALEVPERVAPGDSIPIRVVLTANKVGHDYPTGPLDIIQSWLEIRVTDDQGREVFSSGTMDETNFLAPGSFMFKAEPVDQYGNLIDRHNLWEMVGVRYRRALFPGYSDTVEYTVACPATLLAPGDEAGAEALRRLEVTAPRDSARLEVTASLRYRKVDQFLLNFLLGEESGITAPVTEVARTSVTVEVKEVTVASHRRTP